MFHLNCTALSHSESKNIFISIISGEVAFELETTKVLDLAEYKADFRVEKTDFPFLQNLFARNFTVCDPTEGMCILLKQFVYPCRYLDMIPISLVDHFQS